MLLQPDLVRLYRRSFLLGVLFAVMFFLDLISALIAPVILFVVIFVFHVAVFVMWLNAKCSFFSQIIKELAPEKISGASE